MKKKMKKLVSVLLFLVCFANLAMGCGSSTEKQESAVSSAAGEGGKVDAIKAAGKLVVGTASGYPPYEFVSMENNGEVIGIDVAFAKAIADKLGVKLEVQDMAFGELITALAQGKCDIAIAGMTQTEERAKTIDFSDVYITDEQCMIIRKEDAGQYKTVDDFKGKAVGVEKGSSSEQVVQTEIADAKMNSLSKIADLFLELKNAKIDGIVTSRVV
ncbi:MAG: transporter substrate-binding domain-containing protein [Lachnospiraceae bacterium]